MISRPASAGLLFVFCISDIPVRTFNRTFHQMNNASQSGCVVFCYCNAWNRTELRNAISPRARRSRETDSPPGHQTNNASQSGCVVFSALSRGIERVRVRKASSGRFSRTLTERVGRARPNPYSAAKIKNATKPNFS